MRALLMLTVMLTLACGDDDKPTAPTPTPAPDPAASLIGTWRSTGNNFIAQMTANLKAYLIEGGLNASQADMEVAKVLENYNETFAGSLNFGTDGTVVVDGEAPDRYEVSGDRIYITTSDGETYFVHYTVTETTLTMQYPAPALLSILILDAEDVEEAELLRIMLNGIDVLVFYFSR